MVAQLTIFQPGGGGADDAHTITTHSPPLRFSDLPTALHCADDDDKAVDEDEIKQVEMKKNFIFAMFGAHRRSPAKLNRKRRDSNFRQMTYKKFARVDKYSDYFLGSV